MEITLHSFKMKVRHTVLFALLLLVQGIAVAQNFTDSNLPIVLITTDTDPATGQPMEIPDDPKIWASMKIIYRPDGSRNYVTDQNNAEYLNYNDRIKIELRGSSSQLLDKKQYSWTTYDSAGAKQNVSLLGMPSENDWILNGLAFDASLLRDYLCYNLARQMGQYATRTQYCEVMLNGNYIGLYILQEKIKDDSKRVNIEEITEDDNAGINLTGGYITKADHATGDDPIAWTMESNAQWTDFMHELPKPGDVTQQQNDYIHSQFTALENTAQSNNSNIVNGYPSIIDVPTFLDFMLINELSSNVDAYQYSTYFHKDRGGKLRAGPVWDFNLSLGLDVFGDRSHTDIWQFGNGDNEGAKFWTDLFNNTEYKCYLSKRWNALTQQGQPLNYNSLTAFIDEITVLISEAAVRENERWGTVQNHSAEITAIKAFLAERITWITNNIGPSAACSDVDVPQLVIAKINYNPGTNGQFTESDDQEFIQIINNGSESALLTGIYLSELGISYQFPADAVLEAGQGIYIASNPEVFAQRYGTTAFGQFVRNLSNKSQKLVLADAFGNIIDSVEYTDSAPWPSADGNGSYLILTDNNLDNSLAESWVSSDDINLNAVHAVANTKVLLYPNPAGKTITITAPQIINTIQVYDIYGKLLQTITPGVATSTLDINNYTQGLYMVKIYCGNTVSTQKVIKK